MNKPVSRSLAVLASIELTLSCMVLMMTLIFFGTLAQAKIGTFAAQNLYFNSFLVTTDVGSLRLPIFPGGLSVGLLWLINLTAAFAVRFRYAKKEIGILLSHLGLVLLLAGQGLTQLTAKESRMAIQEGETSNFIIRAREIELAFTMISDPDSDFVISVPESYLSHRKEIKSPDIPFTAQVKAYYPNSELKMGGGTGPSLATQGIGSQISVKNIPVTHRDDEVNNASAFVEIREGSTSLGVYLVSLSLGAPQSFICQGKEYRLEIRERREYLPYTIQLQDFKHDKYPGTNIPKNFSSQIHLVDKEKNEDRDVLIYMNNPLRYRGKTFYQASFGNNDTLSIFQVVENPVWLTPYLSCLMVVIGLGIQFLMHLRKFVRARR